MRLRLELKQTMDMYNSACKGALSVQQKVTIKSIICYTFTNTKNFVIEQKLLYKISTG